MFILVFQKNVGFFLENSKYPSDFYYESKCFPHFDRIRDWTKDCRSRLKKMNESLGRGATLTSGIIIKISCVGEVTEENLKKIAKPEGKI